MFAILSNEAKNVISGKVVSVLNRGDVLAFQGKANSLCEQFKVIDGVIAMDGVDVKEGTYNLVEFHVRKEWSIRARWARRFPVSDVFYRLVTDGEGPTVVLTNEAPVAAPVEPAVSAEPVVEVVDDTNLPTREFLLNKAASVVTEIAMATHVRLDTVDGRIVLRPTQADFEPTGFVKIGDKKSDGTNRRFRAKADLAPGKYGINGSFHVVAIDDADVVGTVTVK